MSRRFIRWVAISWVAALLAGGAGIASADPTAPPPGEVRLSDPAPPIEAEAYSDEVPDPLEATRRDLREQALQEVIAGKQKVLTRDGSKVARVGTKPAPTTSGELGRDTER